jgi:hypothetical protein
MVGEVQTLQQRPEPGDLAGGVVHVGVGQDRGGGRIHRREQVHRRGAVVAAAAQGLAVDGDGALWPLWQWWPAGGRVAAGGSAIGRWPDPARGARSPQQLA